MPRRNPSTIAADTAKTRASAKSYSNEKWVKAVKGDSLYGISRRYGVSVEELAQLNQLKKPYVIQPGQTIFLKPLKTATHKSVDSIPSIDSFTTQQRRQNLFVGRQQ